LDAQDQVRTLAPQLADSTMLPVRSRSSVRTGREHMFVPRKISFTEVELRRAVESSRSCAEVLRKLGLRPAGGNHRTFKKYVDRWEISTAHFDQDAIRREALARAPIPLADILVEHSTYPRGHLKRRLLADGIKQPVCEICGQGATWRGRPLALILDHINGVPDDNRLQNLRIVCPNCAATFDTHCGRKNRPLLNCLRCGAGFSPQASSQRYCSAECGRRWDRNGVPRPGGRKVRERPPYEQLVAEIAATNWCAVGRKYGVSDNAIRKWMRAYEAERASAAQDGAAGGGVPGPVGPAGAEVDAADPAVERRAGGGSREYGGAVGRELVGAVVGVDERLEVVGEREDRRVSDPRWVLGGDGGLEQVVRSERAVGECLEDLALEPAEAGARVGELLEQPREGGDGGPCARLR
jgi:hypothetical protein